MDSIVDVVIPTFRPDERLLRILEGMAAQTVRPRLVRIINTQKDGFDAFLKAQGFAEATSADTKAREEASGAEGTRASEEAPGYAAGDMPQEEGPSAAEAAFRSRFPFAEITHIRKEEFDHGGTRNRGFRMCEGADYVLTMTQDAMPADTMLIGRLLDALQTGTEPIAAAADPAAAEPAGSDDRKTSAGDVGARMPADSGAGNSCGGSSAVRERAEEAPSGDDNEHIMTGEPSPGKMSCAPPGAIAVAYARQLPNIDAPVEERLSREFNYPAQSRAKSEADRDDLGIKTYYCSNVCAMYRMDIWRELNGFPERAIFNEDMIYACKALRAGYRTYYAAQAQVYHSHNYTASQQFHRNFDLGVSQAQNPQVFGGLSSEGEGVSYVKAVIGWMMAEHEALRVPGFVWRCAARLVGYRLGKAYEKLPVSWAAAFSSNKGYWNV